MAEYNNQIILGIAEEGDSENISSPAEQSVSFYKIESENLTKEHILLWRGKICNLTSYNCNTRFDPETVVMFNSKEKLYAAITIERLDSVLLLDITEPRKPAVENLITVGKRPEGITALNIRDKNVILTANEGKRTPQLSIITDTGY